MSVLSSLTLIRFRGQVTNEASYQWAQSMVPEYLLRDFILLCYTSLGSGDSARRMGLLMTAFRHLVLAILFSVTLNTGAAENVSDPAQVERDQILSLTALAVVYKDWQQFPGGRGHNIGSILADKHSVPVFWARNTVNMSGDASQHGEVRLIQGFLNCPVIGKYADGFTVYTTLEPCAMCTGMMSLTRVSRVVYVQADPEYGSARDALVKIGYPQMFEQYSPPEMSQKKSLDEGYKNFKTRNPGVTIIDYLLSPEAKRIFASAEVELKGYKPRFEENVRVVESALAFLNKVPEKGGDDRLAEFCPSN